MISTGQILAAAPVTGIAVAIAGAAVRWPLAGLAAAALASFALIVVWRVISNVVGFNGDFVPAISVGDTGCLVAGALAPAAIAGLLWFVGGTRSCTAAAESAPRPTLSEGGSAFVSWRRWGPALVGGAVGFVINVVIL